MGKVGQLFSLVVTVTLMLWSPQYCRGVEGHLRGRGAEVGQPRRTVHHHAPRVTAELQKRVHYKAEGLRGSSGTSLASSTAAFQAHASLTGSVCDHVLDGVCVDPCPEGSRSIFHDHGDPFCLVNDQGEPCKNFFFGGWEHLPICMDGCKRVEWKNNPRTPVCMDGCPNVAYTVTGDVYCRDKCDASKNLRRRPRHPSLLE